jgi:Cu(I)/Ag(I) efflux system membrane fusion protein
MDDGMLEPRDVVLGLASDERVEIRSGLIAGEWVVSSATFLVDAESNLGAALRGMAGMPGMDLPAPPKAAQPPPAAPPANHDH